MDYPHVKSYFIYFPLNRPSLSFHYPLITYLSRCYEISHLVQICIQCGVFWLLGVFFHILCPFLNFCATQRQLTYQTICTISHFDQNNNVSADLHTKFYVTSTTVNFNYSFLYQSLHAKLYCFYNSQLIAT